MEKIIWSEKYETGIDVMDFQHRVLVERTNDLIELLNKNEIKDHLLPLILFFEDYTRYHFSTEEQFFDSFDYKEKQKHLQEHNSFKEKIWEVKEQYQAGIVEFDENLLKYLMDWLIEHIMGTDMNFAEELKKNMNF